MASIPSLDFVRELKRGRWETIPPVVAVAGAETFLREQALLALRAELDARNVSVERLDADIVDAEELVRSLRSVSLFGGATAYLIRNQRQGSKQEATARFKTELTTYLERPSDANVLIFDGVTWNGSHAVPRRVKKDFLHIDCPEFKPWQTGEVERTLTSYAELIGLRLGPQVATAIREACEGDLSLSARELEKLALIDVDGPVTLEVVEKNLRHRGNDEAFALVEAILVGDIEKVSKLGANGFATNDPGELLKFIGLLESQFRKIGKLSFLLRSGASGGSALGKAGFNPRMPQARTYTEIARRLDLPAIAAQYRLLLEADFASKSGVTETGTLLASLCTKLARGMKG